MPLVVKPPSLACRAEGLAGAGACPHGAAVRPSGKAEGIGPDADSGEPVALCEPPDVVGADVPDVTLVHLPRRYVAGSDEPAQPLAAELVRVVVVRPPVGMQPYLSLVCSSVRKTGADMDLQLYFLFTRKKACCGRS